MSVPVPPAVAEYAVQELGRLRADLAVLAATLERLAGEADVGVARYGTDAVSAGPLLRGVASDVRRIVNPAAIRA